MLSSISFGQNKFTVYFDTDSYQLQLSELNRLDKILENGTELNVTLKDITNVEIIT